MLTEEQQQRFFTDGYLLLADQFDPYDVTQLKSEIERLIQIAENIKPSLVLKQAAGNVIPGVAEHQIMHDGTQYVFSADGKDVRRIVWAAANSQLLDHYSRNTKVTTSIAQLLQTSIASQLTVQVHPKKPHDSTVFASHQDGYVRQVFDPDFGKDIDNQQGCFVQAIIAIDEHTHQNGPLYVIPGSNQLGLIDPDRMQSFTKAPHEVNCFLFSEQERQLKQGLIKKPVLKEEQALLMQPGSILYTHPWLWHRSEANRSATSRFTFITGFCSPHANHKPYPGQGSCRMIDLHTGQCYHGNLTS